MVIHELRLATRALARAKAFAGTAALTLALGIGGATLMFALVDVVLLEPLPVHDEDRLIVAWKKTAFGTFAHHPFGDEAIAQVKKEVRLLEAVAAFSYNGAMLFPVNENGAASYLSAGVVDGDFFRVLGVAPLLGRTLSPADDVFGAEPVVVLDERAWRRRYDRAPDVIGKRLRIQDHAFTIVGVVPAIDLPRGAEAWFSLRAQASRSSDTAAGEAFLRDQDLVARLRAGVSVAQATSELEGLTAEYERRGGRGLVAVVKPYREEVVGDARTPVLVLFGATLLILLIAAANLANLLLLRGESRRPQLAVRAALGAGRGRLAAHLAAEAAVVGLIGGVLGLLLAVGSLGVVRALAPIEIARAEFLRIDGTVALFAAVVTLAATTSGFMVSGLVLIRIEGVALATGSTRMTLPAFRASRRSLVVAQVALSLVALAAAGTLARTLVHLKSADMGFAADGLAFAELFVPLDPYAKVEARRPLFEELTARVRAIPGVESVAPIAVRPYAGLSGWDMPRWVADGQGSDDAAHNPGLDLQSIYPNHFETMGIAIVEGRAINRFDREGAPRVAVISEDAARQVWRGRSAIGQRVKWGGVDSDGPWLTIVGVAAVTRYRELADPRPAIYLPAAQFVDDANTLALRLSVPMETIANELRARVRELDPEVWVVRTGAFAGYLAGPLARPRFAAWLSNVFGAFALALCAVGLYGVLAAFVRQSTREIGVRVALGATAGNVRSLVIGEAARLLCVGVLLGVFGAMATSGLLRGLVFAVHPFDPLTIAGTIAVLVATGGAACAVPIRRATRLDPAALLRTE